MNENSILNNIDEEDEIDFAELLFILKRHLLAILASMFVGAAVALLYTVFLVQPLYKSSSMIYIFSKTTTVTSAIDLQIGSQLTVDFEILGKRLTNQQYAVYNFIINRCFLQYIK